MALVGVATLGVVAGCPDRPSLDGRWVVGSADSGRYTAIVTVEGESVRWQPFGDTPRTVQVLADDGVVLRLPDAGAVRIIGLRHGTAMGVQDGEILVFRRVGDVPPELAGEWKGAVGGTLRHATDATFTPVADGHYAVSGSAFGDGEGWAVTGGRIDLVIASRRTGEGRRYEGAALDGGFVLWSGNDVVWLWQGERPAWAPREDREYDIVDEVVVIPDEGPVSDRFRDRWLDDWREILGSVRPADNAAALLQTLEDFVTPERPSTGALQRVDHAARLAVSDGILNDAELKTVETYIEEVEEAR